MAFTTEAWWNDDPATADRPAGVSLADIPGSVEARLLVAVDTTGMTYWVSRKRGREPEAHMGNRPEKWYLSGGVTDALRLTVMVACERFLPPDGYDFPDMDAQKSALVSMLMQ